jgi:hypothetical protein
MPIGISGYSTGTCAIQSGFMQPTNFDPVTFISSPSTNPSHPATSKTSTCTKANSASSSHLFTINSSLVTTNLHLTFILNFTNPSVYPNHYIDIILWDVDFGAFLVGDELMCSVGQHVCAGYGQDRAEVYADLSGFEAIM